MKVWRICKSQHASSAFSGDGAEQTGGRWNFKGYPLVYTSENLSLAALELFVHVPPGAIPTDLVAICAELAGSVSMQEIPARDLPAEWRVYPAPAKLQQIGTDWIKSRSSLALKVPSVVNPLEANILLNLSPPEMS